VRGFSDLGVVPAPGPRHWQGSRIARAVRDRWDLLRVAANVLS
jgi:hypothetical protein